MLRLIFILNSLFLSSCLYQAGNRRADLNVSIPVSLNTFYVDSYLREKWMRGVYDDPLNSELINFPKDFVPITDSLKGYKYVVELRVSGDSSKNTGYGLVLSSIYDFNRKKWIVDIDSLQQDEIESFKLFFKKNILADVVKYYKNTIPDTLLFLDRTHAVIVR